MGKRSVAERLRRYFLSHEELEATELREQAEVSGAQPLTVRVAAMAGSYGSQWQLLSAGAFISMAVPLLVFFAFQRFFVRGLLAGSVKG